jgi:adenosylhomocysteine nucleosidase
VTTARREPAFVIAATGLLVEAQIAARSANVNTVVSGGNATHLARLIEVAIAAGGRAILSFGIAGGLSEDLQPGSCLVGSEVVHAGKLYRADAAWTGRLARRLTISPVERFQLRSRSQASHAEMQRGGYEEHSEGPPEYGLHRIAGIDRALSIPCDKRALNAATGATAVDMESHVVADLAARHGLPFAVVRAIADPVGRAIPRAALVGMRSDGTMNAVACLRLLVRDPSQVPALVRIGVDTSRAMLQLLRCVKVLGPGLGFFERG